MDSNGEDGIRVCGEKGSVDIDTSASAAAVENDVVFGGRVVRVEEEEGEEEEEEEEEENRGEVFAVLRGFGFGERGDGFRSETERAMFRVRDWVRVRVWVWVQVVPVG